MPINDKVFEDVSYWMREREAIRILKDECRVPPPWTDDPILATYRFCNPRRSDDRVTRWIVENISVPFAREKNLWWMLCAARVINWPPTLKQLIEEQAWPGDDQFDAGAFLEVLLDREQRGEQVYTGAYKVPALARCPGPKSPWIAGTVLGGLWSSRQRFAALFDSGRASLYATMALLQKHRGWGPFLSNQAVIDMRFTSLLSGAGDVSTSAAAGDGTIRGLNRLFGRSVEFKCRQETAVREMREVFALVQVHVPEVEIDFSDVGNVMCEVDKFLRAKNGEGKLKKRYKPSPAFEPVELRAPR